MKKIILGNNEENEDFLLEIELFSSSDVLHLLPGRQVHQKAAFDEVFGKGRVALNFVPAKSLLEEEGDKGTYKMLLTGLIF